MNELLKELYQEIIMDHGNDPRNFGECKNHNRTADGHNPLCGDKVHITLMVNESNVIEDVKFSGVGCAISIASASLMTESLKNQNLDYAEKLFTDFICLVRGEDRKFEILNEDDSLCALKGVGAFPMRVKCATLAWHTFKSALSS
jgi:nitrogen fixation NifU-like protein